MKEVNCTIHHLPMNTEKQMNNYFCIFGGTTEGRLLAEYLSKNKIKNDLFVATDYGEQIVKNIECTNVYKKRLNKDEMINLFKQRNYTCIVDATHPFAKNVTENIKEATNSLNIKLVRIIRKTPMYECTYVSSMEEAVSILNNENGNILLTTGSKDLELFTNVNNYKERIYPRILPMYSSLEKAKDFGYLDKNIICMQGPFSTELNEAMIKHVGAKFLVTKESSKQGGFEEKVNACKKMGIKCIAVKKPQESGYTIEEFISLIEKEVL